MRKLLLISLLTIAACSSGPNPPKINYTAQELEYIDQYTEAAAGTTRNFKLGKSYKVDGEWYYPAHMPTYEQEGKASWYGPGLEGNQTANGERFNSGDFTAAHTTLPMPSIVEVTNLDNGKKVNVRVNDRGPFHSKRIIDVSKAAAQELGMLKTGTANVKVRLLDRETLEFMQYAKE